MVDLAPLIRVADRWRQDAAVLRRRGAPAGAELLEECATELDEALTEWRLESLTLERAADESGLAYDTVQRKVAAGEWPNTGRKGKPRVRRCDVLSLHGSPHHGPIDREQQVTAALLLRDV